MSLSISDDDLCSECTECLYRPGDESNCTRDFPGYFDADLQSADSEATRVGMRMTKHAVVDAIIENMGAEEPPEPEMVFPIASGYEWTCPCCDTEHHTVEITGLEVQCQKCKTMLQVFEWGHAYG